MSMRLVSFVIAGLFAAVAGSVGCASSNRTGGGTGGLGGAGGSGVDAGIGGLDVLSLTGTGGVSGPGGQGGNRATGGSGGAATPAGGTAGGPSTRTSGGGSGGHAGSLSFGVGGATGVGAAGSTATRSGGGGGSGGSGGRTGAGGSGVDGGMAQGQRHLIIDSDTNNEMDDQHAIAYALFNADQWHIDGITTNATLSGGPASQQTIEAQRVVALCASEGTVQVYTGATKNYEDIKGQLAQADYDGRAAVEFIISSAGPHDVTDKLVVVAIGKLTNIALALDKDPSIINRMRVLWLGSNWPNTGEYNLINDPPAVIRLVDSQVELDIATVREIANPQPATAAVTVTLDELKSNMAGKGPTVPAVVGRNGGSFTHFGDYSIDLMEHIGVTTRPLYDMSAVALLKNPAWATADVVTNAKFDGTSWSAGSADATDKRVIRFWRSFNRDAIVNDLFARVSQPQLQK